MEISGRVRMHCIVPDTPKFVLFGVEVITEFSRTVLPRRYTDFRKFHNGLCYFAQEPFKDTTLLSFIPKLPNKKIFQIPTEQSVIDHRKKELDKYVQAVFRWLRHPAFNKFDPWISYIRHFFELDIIEAQEHVLATRIQEKYRAWKEWLTSRKVAAKKFLERGWVVNIEELPDNIHLNIFAFIGLGGLTAIACVNKRWYKLSKTPILYRSINLFHCEQSISVEFFERLCMRSWQLSTLDLRFCSYITNETLYCISQICNPLALHELYLDGCENIDNVGLLNLTSKFSDGVPKSIEYLMTKNQGNPYFDPKQFEVPPNLKGGARGLRLLSLVECRKVSAEGLAALRKLKKLRTLVLLGCVLVDDSGIQTLFERPMKLTELNLSGTAITVASLHVIKEQCPKLRSIDLRCCKHLSPDDEHALPDLEVDIQDDLVKFHLYPYYTSRLPKITDNILKTRSTLSVQRVISFIQKKLMNPSLEIDVLLI